MSPRFELFTALRFRNGASIAAACRPFQSKASLARASTVAQKRRRQDPYALAQARARRAANLSRQEVLRVERSKAFGDPVRGLTTPFVESFDTAGLGKDITDELDTQSAQSHVLNHFITTSELKQTIDDAEQYTAFIPSRNPQQRSSDTAKQAEKSKENQEQKLNAREALTRIVNISNGSSKDRARVNIQRCIETFGRHNTDKILRPKAPSTVPRNPDIPLHEKTPRAGPDTGSSEVQIAILTAKIRSLADHLEARGNKDKMNKRNLRLLVHRRQKLLKYLRRQERGSERWETCIKTLGLTEGTWSGEISL